MPNKEWTVSLSEFHFLYWTWLFIINSGVKMSVKCQPSGNKKDLHVAAFFYNPVLVYFFVLSAGKDSPEGAVTGAAGLLI